jgi:hypothetical protein
MTVMTPNDRQLLGEGGLALDDNAYAQTIAGIGMYQKSYGEHQLIGWSPHNFRIFLERKDPKQIQEALSKAHEAWLTTLASIPNKRLAVEEGSIYQEDPDPFSIVRILNHPSVGSDSVIIEVKMPQADLKWQWPLRIEALQKDLERLNLCGLAKVWPSSNLAEIDHISREKARCEILVILDSARSALSRILALPYHIRACHVLLISPVDVAWRSLSSHVNALTAETQAGAVSLIACKEDEAVDHINRFVEELSHNTPFDIALSQAFPRDSSFHLIDLSMLDTTAMTTAARDIGRSLRHLPRKARLSVPDESLVRAELKWTSRKSPTALGAELEKKAYKIHYDAESKGASSLKDISVAMRSARHEVASREIPRFLQGDLFKYAEGRSIIENRGFVVGFRYRLDVFIGPEGEGAIMATRVFDDTQLDWQKRNSYTLQVMFADPRQWDQPFTGTLILPREGTSSKCSFVFSPTMPGPFAGRITLYYRGRILQTALLESTVVEQESALEKLNLLEPLRFRVESQIRHSLSTLDDRRRFDVCMVLNHTAAGTPAASVAGKEGAYIASLDKVKPHLSAINGILNDVANDVKRYSKGLLSKDNAKLLYDLACEGRWIYRNLVLDYLYSSSAAEAFRKAEHLQILSTRPDLPIPLEFVYEYPPPKECAPVCKNAEKALRDGQCPADCKPDRSPAPRVCPLGFWGLSKVIERHEIKPSSLGLDMTKPALVMSEPIEGRDILSLKGASLLAASKQVPVTDRNKLEQSMKAAWTRFGKVISVNGWKNWQETVKNMQPVMLLALPHAGGAGANISLEISGDTLKSDYIDESYLKGNATAAGPLVVLFGCDTANVANTEAYTGHVTVFRQADAALVVGTVATVFGPDAAKVAEQLVLRLVAAAEKSTQRFGEVLRQVKREAVADSLMLAMCLIAFGDADWRFN